MTDHFIVAATDDEGKTVYEKVETPETIAKHLILAERLAKEMPEFFGDPLDRLGDDIRLVDAHEWDWCGTGRIPVFGGDGDGGPAIGGGVGLWGPDQPIDPDNPINPWAMKAHLADEIVLLERAGDLAQMAEIDAGLIPG